MVVQIEMGTVSKIKTINAQMNMEVLKMRAVLKYQKTPLKDFKKLGKLFSLRQRNGILIRGTI